MDGFVPEDKYQKLASEYSKVGIEKHEKKRKQNICNLNAHD